MKRKKIKTILCHMAIITICAGVFCHGYINGLSISKYDSFYSYAEADNWASCDTSDLVTAFRYYCKSRNLALEGSVADALTSFTTTTFNNICSTLGIDPTQLQAELKKTTAGNLGLRFLFSQTGITAYNRIFAEFLQNNDLAVGDTVDNENIYSGESFTDADGNTCLVWDMPSESQSYNGNSVPNRYGSKYKYDGYIVKNNYDNGNRYINFNIPRINDSNYLISEDIDFTNGRDGLSNIYSSVSFGADGWPRGCFYAIDKNNKVINGEAIVYRVNGGITLYIGQFVDFRGTNTNGGVTGNCRWFYFNYFNSPDGLENADVYITTNNNTINNNSYNNNYTIIYNDGDTYYTDDDDEPLPSTPPGGGGGGGDNPGGDPDNWNPTTPTIPTPTNPNFPTVNLPEIDIPDLPSLNFSLGDLRNKFPFSLPFDIIAVLNVLDGEPQAPHIEATVPIGRWYTWEMDFDFSEFDNYARIFRAFEFIGFCIGLAIFTVHFVKG